MRQRIGVGTPDQFSLKCGLKIADAMGECEAETMKTDALISQITREIAIRNLLKTSRASMSDQRNSDHQPQPQPRKKEKIVETPDAPPTYSPEGKVQEEPPSKVDLSA